MNKEYTLKSTNSNVEAVKSKIIQDLNEMIGARQDCKVMIQALDFRGVGALNAYWMMIGSIVKWDADNHGYKADVWDEWFKREAGLTEVVDLMPLWKIKYKDILIKYDKCRIEFCEHDEEWRLSYLVGDYPNQRQRFDFISRFRRRLKTRSISNKGDVTKEEMSRLLMTVIEFGAQNEVPDCYIKDTELENMLRSYNK